MKDCVLRGGDNADVKRHLAPIDSVLDVYVRRARLGIWDKAGHFFLRVQRRVLHLKEIVPNLVLTAAIKPTGVSAVHSMIACGVDELVAIGGSTLPGCQEREAESVPHSNACPNGDQEMEKGLRRKSPACGRERESKRALSRGEAQA